MKTKWLYSILLISLLGVAVAPRVLAAPMGANVPVIAGLGVDNLPHPKGQEQAALKAKALEARLQGKASGKVHEVARGQFVELGLERTDRVFVIITEFGDNIHPDYGGTAGPVHNQIPKPDRKVDNTTIWQADFNKAYFQNLYFTQMADYYLRQSSGRYTINGDVTEWVRVPYNEARYGNNLCGSAICPDVWYLIRDAINQWTADRLAEGWSNAQIHDYLATFDQWDRYDANGNGNFNEPDGYIDHFQIVHAGMGEESGGGAQAIWSHRWYTSYYGIGQWGPPGALFGGMEFGGDGDFGQLGGPNAAGVWVGDYSIQPENGSLGVFVHEYTHDLGLPDQYDTAGGENSTGFWTSMSGGSYLGDGSVNGLGTRPGDLSAWEKYQLGWLKYEVAYAGRKSEHKLGPAETTTKQAQALFVILPEKKITNTVAVPYAGSVSYYSGSGNSLDNNMLRIVTLPAGEVSLSAQVNYQTELDNDYFYLMVNGVPLETNLSTNINPYGQNLGSGITGSSGGNWVNLTADLSAFAGQNVALGFRYRTDLTVSETGFMVDEISIDGQFVDGAEADAGWSFAGFKASNGNEIKSYFNAYIAEFRQYRDYDKGLKTGPFNFGFLNTLPRWVEHFPYQDGLLISYWDSSYTDNNTSVHPGAGLILPIDAHPKALMRPDGIPWRPFVQSYDSTFGLRKTDAITLYNNGVKSVIPSLPGVSVFNDMKDFWDPSSPAANVITPNTGTTIRIKSISAQGGFMQVAVNK